MTELAGKNGRDKVVSRVIRFSKVGLCLTISRVWRHWGERFSLFRNWNFSSTVRRRIFCGVITIIIPTNPIIMCLFCLTILQNPIRTDQACLQWSCAETRSEILSRQEVYGKALNNSPRKMSIPKDLAEWQTARPIVDFPWRNHLRWRIGIWIGWYPQ